METATTENRPLNNPNQNADQPGARNRSVHQANNHNRPGQLGYQPELPWRQTNPKPATNGGTT